MTGDHMTGNQTAANRHRRQSSAFTLVELLVVVAIIAILIAMLLPALTRARAQSKAVACESNLRQIVIATLGYAADNRGMLPPREGAGDSPIGNGTENGIYDYTGLWYTPTGSTTNIIGSNLGMLILTGYLGKEDANTLTSRFADSTFCPVRYCPGIQSTDIAFNSTMSNGGTQQANFIYSSSYLYNPHWAFCSLTGNWPYTVSGAENLSKVSWYTKVNSFDPYRCVACDMLWEPQVMSHINASSYTFNMAFIDGHVASVTDKVLFNPNNGARWPSGSGGIFALDDDIDILETEADGRDPFTANADPSQYRHAYSSTQHYIYRLQSGSSSSPADSSVDTAHPFVPWL
jgi:prepilin-type N-terminal cleavage/methylation domain-containing protein/prepilin-type processing-associated H-X9-DG protein